MKTQTRIEKIYTTWDQAAYDMQAPEAFWADEGITPEELIELDPLRITDELVDLAEHPELADPNIQSLPNRHFSIEREAAWRKRMKAELQAQHAKQQRPSAVQQPQEVSKEEGSL